jgi:hypothetical protein
MIRIFFVLAVLAATAAAAEPVTTNFSGPDWLKFTRIYDGKRFVIGDYPIDAEFGGDTTGIAQAVVGAVQIPSSVTAPNHSAGVAGYARTLSPSQMAVGLHGFGGIMVDGGQAEGGHFLTSNCGSQSCASKTGVNAADNFIIEADINMMKLPDGSNPKGNAFGLIFFGGSEAVPEGAFQAIRVDSPGVFHKPILAWKDALFTANGTAKVGVNLGTLELTAPGPSQPIYLRSRSDAGEQQQSSIESDKGGDILLSPASGVIDVNGTSVRIQNAKTPSSSTDSCDVGQMQWDADFVYVCVASNRWRRSALQDW